MGYACQSLDHVLDKKKEKRRKKKRICNLRPESPWLKSYIVKNIKLRMDVKNDFEKDNFKLLNNSVLEKTME